MTGSLRLGIGTPTILDALAQVYTGSRKDRPVWSGRTTSAPISASSGLRSPRSGFARRAGAAGAARRPCAGHALLWLSDASEIVARLGGRCMAEYKYDGMRFRHTALLMATLSCSRGGRSA